MDRKENKWYKAKIRSGPVLTDKARYIEGNIREGRIRSMIK